MEMLGFRHQLKTRPRTVTTALVSLVVSSILCGAQSLDAYAALAPNSSATAPPLSMQQLRALCATGKFFQARTEAAALLKQYPLDPELHFAYATILRDSGQSRLALQEFQRAAQLDPHKVSALVAISQLQLDNLDIEAAIESARKAMVLKPDSVEARLAFVAACIAGDRVVDAERQLQSMISAGSANPTALHLAYEVKMRKGDYEQARHYLETAIALGGSAPRWKIELADLEQRMNNPQRARQVLETILARDPAETEARLRLAKNLELIANDLDGAIYQYQQLLVYEPDSASAMTGIERCRAKKNNVALRVKTGLHSLSDAIAKFFSNLRWH